MLIEASRRLLPAYGRLRAWPSLPWQPTAHSAARALIATTPGRGGGREGVSGARVASPREGSRDGASGVERRYAVVVWLVDVREIASHKQVIVPGGASV